MDIFGKDIIIGNFRASDFGLMASTIKFDEESEYEMGNDITIAEQFIGRNPVPVYLDYSYVSRLFFEGLLAYHLQYNKQNLEQLKIFE